METEIQQVSEEKKVAVLTTPIAIIIAGVIIAGSVLIGFSWLKGDSTSQGTAKLTEIPKVTSSDNIRGDSKAKIVLVMYEDYQCPFCGKFFNETEEKLKELYVANNQIALVYRDYAFLGPESLQAGQAAYCAGDQGKYWEYHDYLFSHQNGENKGGFSDVNLKNFAKGLALNSASFDQCLDNGKYKQKVLDSTKAGNAAGIEGTPKGFILKKGKVIDTIDGAQPFDVVNTKIQNALK